LASIETKRQQALKELGMKYSTADKAKKSFAYIAIISLSILYGVILLNDLVKLFGAINDYLTNYFEEEDEMNELANDDELSKQDEVKIEIEQIYSEELNEKLERFHQKLIRAKAKRLCNNPCKILFMRSL
jgi:cell division protein ZapA (FtsZ GTPase activity inhibitor)